MRTLAAIAFLSLFAPTVTGQQPSPPPAGGAPAPAVPPVAPPAVPPPLGADDAKAYAELVDRVVATREGRKQVVDEMARRLRELSRPATNPAAPVDPAAAEAAKKDLLIRRRLADVMAERARRDLDLHWLVRTVTPEQRQQMAALGRDDLDALLDARGPAQRLGVPLPPTAFAAAPVDAVLAYVEKESGTRVVADWPALAEVGMKRRSPVTVTIGRYDRPAVDTLEAVVRSLTGGRGVVDLSAPDAAVVTTEAGQGRFVDLQLRLAKRVANAREWEPLDGVLEPVNLGQVPLSDALVAGLPPDGLPPLFVDWAGLREAGVTPALPVNVRLGVHTVGQRLAVLADGLGERPEVKRAGGLQFDVHPAGYILFSTRAGYARAFGNVSRVLAAAPTQEARQVLLTRLPEVALAGVPLEQAVAFVRDATRLDVRADWPSLQATGLTPRTPVTAKLTNVPLAVALAVVVDAGAGKPAVEWEVGDGTIVARGPR